MRTSSITHYINDSANIAVLIADTTKVCQEAETRHLAGRIPATALAKALTAAALIGANLKDGERQSLQINFNGKLKTVFAEADSEGRVRGFVQDTALPDMDPSMARWIAALGTESQLAVVRSRNGKLLYNGSVHVEKPTITHDVNRYLHESEQLFAAIEMNAQYKNDGLTRVKGVFAQLLPGGRSEDFEAAKERFDEGKLFEGLAQGYEDAHLLSLVWPIGEFKQKGIKPITFECQCSRDRVRGMLKAIGVPSLREIIEEDKQAEITCQFCNMNYLIELEELEGLLAEAESERSKPDEDGSAE